LVLSRVRSTRCVSTARSILLSIGSRSEQKSSVFLTCQSGRTTSFWNTSKRTFWFKVIWEEVESLPISVHQVAAAIHNCMLGWGLQTRNLPFPEHKVSFDHASVAATWHVNPSNGLSRLHECDRRQTDRLCYGEMCSCRRNRFHLKIREVHR